MKHLTEYIYEVSSELIQRAADKAKEKSTNAKNEPEKILKAEQAKRLEKAAKEYKKAEEKIEKTKRKEELLKTLKPNNRDELRWLVRQIFNKEKNKKTKVIDLNQIDTSNITDMSFAFANLTYQKLDYEDKKIDVSKWDVSHVTNMYELTNHGASHQSDGYIIRHMLDLSNWDIKKNLKEILSNVHPQARLDYFNDLADEKCPKAYTDWRNRCIEKLKKDKGDNFKKDWLQTPGYYIDVDYPDK